MKTRNRPPIVGGAAVSIGISAMVDRVLSIPIKRAISLLDQLKCLLTGNSRLIAYCVLSGMICCALFLLIVSRIKKRKRELINKHFYLSVAIFALLYAVASLWYESTREDFGAIRFFPVVSMWMETGLLTAMIALFRKSKKQP